MTSQHLASNALFSDRADHYANHRPSYPPKVLAILRRLVPPPADAVDVAAGTGILSRALAAAGYRTVAVEPNAAMRAAIEAHSSPGLQVADGAGEETGLRDGSADLITVAQALHWLDPRAALAEFRRISRPGCLAAIIWNSRDFDATPFMRDYRAILLEHAPEYRSMKTTWANLHERARDFFPEWSVETVIDNTQHWELDTLLGNLWSLSYAPDPGTPGRSTLETEARRIFGNYAASGHIEFRMRTYVVTGPVGEA